MVWKQFFAASTGIYELVVSFPAALLMLPELGRQGQRPMDGSTG